MKAHQLLEGKKGIIFGALDEQSIATHVARQCVAEGAKIVLTNAPVAMRFGTIQKLGEELNAAVIPADATSNEDLNNLIDKSLEALGGPFDFILHSIGMSLNMRKGQHYTDLNHEWMHKTLDITYIAAQRVFPDYNEMADAKALLESFARSFGYHFATKKKVRVNTISQSPTRTTAGSGVKGFDDFFSYADAMAPLGNATSDDCAGYCVTLFSDYTRAVTMQNLFHDGGFSSMGVNPAVLGQQ
jgi:enoyl-[acyl-carrier protein] reductase I